MKRLRISWRTYPYITRITVRYIYSTGTEYRHICSKVPNKSII